MPPSRWEGRSSPSVSPPALPLWGQGRARARACYWGGGGGGGGAVLPSSLARSSGRKGNSRGPCARPLHPCSPRGAGGGAYLLQALARLGFPTRHFTLGGLNWPRVHQATAFCSVGLQPATARLQTGFVRAAAVLCPRGGRVTHQRALEEAGLWDWEVWKVRGEGTSKAPEQSLVPT